MEEDFLEPDSEALGWPWSALSRERRLHEAGWLPHSSTPWRLINAAPVTKASTVVERYYREHWSVACRVFETSLDTYAIDDEAKATFREGLKAHEVGLYRTVPRTLFPEIERVARMELHGGSPKSFASLKELRGSLGALLPRDVAPPNMVGWELSKRLIKHLYKKAEDPISIELMRLDAVPNRHASIHGLVSYSSFQSSFNALVMADFVFRVICVVKERRGSAT